jgi:GMP synthase-like glutamine amidotransferase
MLFVVQNDPEVPAGTYGQYLEYEGVQFRTVRPCAGESLPQIAEVSAAMVLGGAMGVHDTIAYPFLQEVKVFIGECVRTGTPFLGICLGGQLLADVLGARVHTGLHGEKGTLPVTLTPEGVADPLFAGIDPEFFTFQWHDDSFAIPATAVPLASSPACPNQAFRYGENAYGTQFHPEVNRAIVDSWARWTDKTAPAADVFLSSFVRLEEHYRQASRRLLCNFLHIAGLYS